jgi:hypothetical protein
MPTAVTLSYDLDQGDLIQQAGQPLDTYLSSTIHIDPITLTLADSSLLIHVNFIEQENGAGQQVELRTLGTGLPQFEPTTFATKTGPAHDFGPGIIIGGVNLTGFEGMNLRAIPDNPTGPLSPDYASLQTGAIAGHDGPDAFEFFLQAETFGGHPDMLDDPYQPLRFPGFTLQLDYAGGEPSVTIDTITFNLLSAEVEILRAPATFERRDEPIGSTFVGDSNDASFGGTAGHDIFVGGNGNESFFGEDGPDVAYGNGGNDILIMGNRMWPLGGAAMTLFMPQELAAALWLGMTETMIS